MKITDLLKIESIDLQAEVVDKRGAVNRLVDLMEKSGAFLASIHIGLRKKAVV